MENIYKLTRLPTPQSVTTTCEHCECSFGIMSYGETKIKYCPHCGKENTKYAKWTIAN